MFVAEYRCPQCQGPVVLSTRPLPTGAECGSGEAYNCRQCACDYPIIGGIADFRVYPDPYIDLEADRKKGLLLAEKAEKLSFAELVSFYYSITPEVPGDLAEYYSKHHLAGVTRGAGILQRFSSYGLAPPARADRVIDLGCGTGGFLTAAAATGADLIGVDIAFRWLIVARRRLEELGHRNVQLICACADYLPFPENCADVIVAENLIEHVKNQHRLFAEIERVRRPQCRIMARTVNRFALGAEPHVGVWGVGYLPRTLMNGYVQALKKIPYEHIHLQSLADLRTSIKRSSQRDLRVGGARLSPQDYQHHSGGKQKIFKTYSHLVQSGSFLAPLVARVGPYLDVVSTTAKLNHSPALAKI